MSHDDNVINSSEDTAAYSFRQRIVVVYKR